MSELDNEYNDITEAEELPLEDQKKAINLQDLIYLKKYIDDNHYDVPETDALIENKVAEVSAAKVREYSYTKDEVYNKTETYNKEEIDANHYTKDHVDDIFYKKSDTVANADNATKVNGVEITKDEAGLIKNDGNTIPQRRELLWSGSASSSFNPNNKTSTTATCTFTTPPSAGAKLEVHFGINSVYPMYIKANGATHEQTIFDYSIDDGDHVRMLMGFISLKADTSGFTFNYKQTVIKIPVYSATNVTSEPAGAIGAMSITKIYEIIE